MKIKKVIKRIDQFLSNIFTFIIEELFLPLLKGSLIIIPFFAIVGYSLSAISEDNFKIITFLFWLGLGIIGYYASTALDSIQRRILKYNNFENLNEYEEFLVGLGIIYLKTKLGRIPTIKEVKDEVARRNKWIEANFNKTWEEFGGGERGAHEATKVFFQDPPEDFKLTD